MAQARRDGTSLGMNFQERLERYHEPANAPRRY